MARKPTPRQARCKRRGRGNRAAAGASPSRAAGGPALRPDLRTARLGQSQRRRQAAFRERNLRTLRRFAAGGARGAAAPARRRAGHGASGAGHLRQPPARAQAQDLQRRGARQRLSARAGGAGGAGRRCRAPGGPAPHRRAVAQDRGGAPGLRRIAGAGAHVGRGRSGVPRQHRRSQRQRLLSGRAGEHSRFHQRLHAPDAQPHAHRLAPARPCWTSTPPYSRPSARRTASTRAWPCSSTWAGRGTGWWTASATERGNRIFTTQARHNKRRGPRADK